MAASFRRSRILWKLVLWGAGLFAIGVLLLWARSNWFYGDTLEFGSAKEAYTFSIASRSGAIIVRRVYIQVSGQHWTSNAMTVAHGWNWDTYAAWNNGFFRWFEYENTHRHVPASAGNGAIDDGQFELTIPHWSLVAAALAVIGVSIWRLARISRRDKAGLCATCGYDLRASVGRCPECGSPVTARRPAGT